MSADAMAVLSGRMSAPNVLSYLSRSSRKPSRSAGKDAVANGADAQAFNDKIKALEATHPDLEAKLSRPADQPLLHPNLAKVYREKVERLTEAFQGMAAKSSSSSAV
jgi:hypothetical protein